jgi:tetratricopeptide (TPR) repeat protein
MMRVTISVVLIFLLQGVSSFCLADKIHDDAQLDQAVATSNSLFLDARFDEGIDLLKKLENPGKKSPALPFFIANGYWWKIFRVYVYDKYAKTTPFDDDFNHYLDESIARAESQLDTNPRDIQALFYIGNAYSLKSRVKGLRGSYFSAGRDAAKGKRYLDQVLEIEPSQSDAYYNLGVYNYLSGTLPGYAKILKLFLFLPGGSKEKGLSLLKLAGQKSKYFGAESQLLLARFYADFEEQPAEAARIVHSFHQNHPGNAWFQYWLGTLYSDELNDYDRAEEIYVSILDQCRRGVPTYTAELKNQSALKLARVRSRKLDPEKAVEEIRELIASKPKDPGWILAKAHLDLGNIYDQIGMRNEALLSYKQVLSLKEYKDFHDQARKLIDQDYNQKNADIYRLNLDGRRLAAAGKFEEAELSLKKILEKYPNNEQTLYALAETAYLKGSYPESAELLNRLIDRNPKEPKWLLPGIYVRLGMVYEARKQQEQAKRSYMKALETKFIASDDRNQAKRALKLIAQNRQS